MAMSESIEKAADLIGNADSLLITAGAGLGVDSGLPDFRGPGGFWGVYPALGKAKMNFADIACPDAFVEQPELAWGFYGHRLNLYRNTPPGESYEILLRLAQAKPNGAFIFTSNVDGHFQMAGFDPKQICEIHGSIHHLHCLNRCTDSVWSADALKPEIDEENCLMTNMLPLCPFCGSLARPNIVMFGDWSCNTSRQNTQHRAFNKWVAEHQNAVTIEIGAGTDIPTIRMIGEQQNFPLIRINKTESETDCVGDVGIQLAGVEALRLVEDMLNSRATDLYARGE